jgi:hypothetical protein
MTSISGVTSSTRSAQTPKVRSVRGGKLWLNAWVSGLSGSAYFAALAA